MTARKKTAYAAIMFYVGIILHTQGQQETLVY